MKPKGNGPKKAKNGGKFFGVRTIYKTTALGKPKLVDQNYVALANLIEERVVLFKAKSFGEAIRKAEKEARLYAKPACVNRYGQRLVTKYLNCCDAFELSDQPKPGAEVYSTTEVIQKPGSLQALLDNRFGKASSVSREKSLRAKFLNVEFARKVVR